jgi:hypothetical protein
VPRPSIAPLSAALGVALLALSLVFGIAMALAAIVPLLVGSRAWPCVMAEYGQSTRPTEPRLLEPAPQMTATRHHAPVASIPRMNG